MKKGYKKTGGLVTSGFLGCASINEAKYGCKGGIIALHQIIVALRRSQAPSCVLLDLEVSAAQKRSTGAFLLAYPLPPPPAAAGGRGMGQSPLRNQRKKAPFWVPLRCVVQPI